MNIASTSTDPRQAAFEAAQLRVDQRRRLVPRLHRRVPLRAAGARKAPHGRLHVPHGARALGLL